MFAKERPESKLAREGGRILSRILFTHLGGFLTMGSVAFGFISCYYIEAVWRENGLPDLMGPENGMIWTFTGLFVGAKTWEKEGKGV